MNYVRFNWHLGRRRRTKAVVRLLGIKSGIIIADYGPGSGYRVVRVSPIIGAGGRVIAEDNRPEDLRSLRRRVRDLGLQNSPPAWVSRTLAAFEPIEADLAIP
jgi:predicted methyltransferase